VSFCSSACLEKANRIFDGLSPALLQELEVEIEAVTVRGGKVKVQ